MMRFGLVIIIFLLAACAGNDKKIAGEDVVSPIIINGDSLFNNNCTSCHKPEKDFFAPALKGVSVRWNDKKAMYEFIRNPAKSVVENAYAKKLFEKWNQTLMTPFDLTDAEIDAIMNYCENYKAIH